MSIENMGELLGGLNPLSHRCAMPDSPFCRCATSSPGRGKSFLSGGAFCIYRSAQIKLPLRGSWQSRQALTERVTIRPQQPTVRPHQSPAVTAVPLFVTFGDISPRHGENLSLPGEAFWYGKLCLYPETLPPCQGLSLWESCRAKRG